MLASHKGEIPFVTLVLPFLLGISAALAIDLSGYQLLLTVMFGVLLLAFVVLGSFYHKSLIYTNQWAVGLITHALLLLAGTLCDINYDNRNTATYFEKAPAEYLLVKINNEPQLKGNFLRFTAAVEVAGYSGKQTPVSGTLLLVLPTDSAHAANIDYGDELLIPARYTAIDPPFNPAEFNYRQYLSHQNIYAQSFLNPPDVVFLNKNAGNPVIAYSLQLRKRLVGQFKLYMRDTSAIAVASTLILGYKAELDNDILQAYSKTGTIHVLSVSGAHVAIIFWMINLLLGFLDKYRYGKLFKAVLSIGLIWYYSLLTGLSPAVCRAAVMISMVILGNTFTRYINMLNMLALSAFVLLLADPFLLTDVGFQLSYLAVAGLVVFQPIVYNWLDINNKWLDKLWLLCSVSIAAQLITFPLSAYYFHQFPVYFLVSNLLIIVPSAVIMGLGVACLLCAQAGWVVLARLLATGLQYSILWMNKGLRFIEHLPYASIGKIWITRGEYLLLFFLLILLFCWMYYRRTLLLTVSLMCLLVLSVSLSNKRIAAMRSSNITYFNLKKYPAILFKQGNSAVLVTNLTDTDKSYRYSLQPCLDSARIDKLTLVPFGRDTATAFLAKNGNLIRFINTDVLVVDKSTINIPQKPKLFADHLFITDNPAIDEEGIERNYSYRTLILGANLTNKRVKTFKDSALKNYKKMYILKRNKALIIESN